MHVRGATLARLACVVVACAGVAACDSDDEPTISAATPPAAPDAEVVASVDARLDDIQAGIDDWRDAPDVASAHAAAELVRNLVVGPGGPGYGDTDGDGTVAGEVDDGLLPGLDGEPSLADELDGTCADRDVLGGSWRDPEARWQSLARRIDSWTPDDNRFPELPSHPQRIVGWASLTLDSDDLVSIHEYAGHAQLHVDVTRRAAACGDEDS